jgi:poly(hydroxyalkanoate) depolymerase family esterase
MLQRNMTFGHRMASKINQLLFGGPRLARPPRLLEATRRILERLLDETRHPQPPPQAPPTRAPDVGVATHAFDGMTRDYRLYVPSNAKASPALVVMLHGCTQDAADFATGTRMDEAAERSGFLVLYPQQSRAANPSGCWNWFGAREQHGAGEAALIADLTRRIVATEGVDPKRVYIAGLSAGGAMATIVAAAHPTLFAAVGVHSGLPAGAAGNLPDAMMAMRNGARRNTASTVPTIVFHGDEDHTVHPRNADVIIASIGTTAIHGTHRSTGPAGASPRYTRTEYFGAGGEVVAEQWSLHGAGHAWAGGDPAGSHTDPRGIDATGEMLRFFDVHRR